ncbi:HD domain-containing phosphohydrolase [Salinicola aestuarinus]|uniref:HD domain-containing phosphohydrolase n=1 Tax=Salinicola aestuarinus TaxID=1949082 RepID=UPI000DA22838|nr:HD domain-containing phosphohydrolase [Salinicola aestuarinus]
MSETASTDIVNAKAKWEWLEPLYLKGGVSLAFEPGDDESWPVLLDEVTPDESMVVDVTAIPALAAKLQRGDTFHLFGHVNGALVRTGPLVADATLESNERLRYRCGYPEFLSTVHRRNTYRAEIRHEMGVTATLLLTGQPTLDVELRNLSLGGCLLAVRLSDALALKQDQRIECLTLHFPSGQRLEVNGYVRHVRNDADWTLGLVGCEFDTLDLNEERKLWYCVKEIEREGARSALTSDKALAPSTLFRSPDGRRPKPAPVMRESTVGVPSGNATARRLKHIADYLNAQQLQLQNGGEIAASLLSRQADSLVALGEQGRESLLYAMGYLSGETRLTQHSLAVAIHATDLARWQGHPRETLKAIAASALVHDLGKSWLPPSLLESQIPLDEDQRDQLGRQVAALIERLQPCRWLDPTIAVTVIMQVNERLDGSGYPLGVSADQLDELGRMMAVVDVIDALTRPRADRAAWTRVEAYRYLLASPAAFDNAWVQRYIKRFGTTPVGSLVKYSSGALAWVQRLDEQGKPLQVHLVLNDRSPERRLDQILVAPDIGQLGRLEGAVAPESFGLSLA